jgi:plasmid segregation protein ParM
VVVLAVDQGYGYTKAVCGPNRAVFPSAASGSPAGALADLDLGGRRPGHVVSIREGAGAPREYLVGEAALRAGRAVEFTLAREKFRRGFSRVLLFAAACLVGAAGEAVLACGLPLAYYRHQRRQVREALLGAGAWVSVDGGPERRIAFREVLVFPQAVGALFAAGGLPERGLVGLVDVGYYTTDYLLVELEAGGASPLGNYCSSVEVGVHTALKLFSEEFQRRTGKPLSLVDAQELWSKEEVSFAGARLDLKEMVAEARQAAGKSIAEAVQAAWSEKIDFLERVLLAGGGALEFLPSLSALFCNSEVVQDPQFANALGFLKMAGRALGGRGA